MIRRLFLLVSIPVLLQPLLADTLSLKKAINMGIKNNPRTLEFLARIKDAEARLRFAGGFYDWQLAAGVAVSDADQARISIFQPENIKSNLYELNLSKAMTTGTSIGLTSSLERTEASSAFNIFSQQYSSELAVSIRQSILDGLVGQPGRRKVRSEELRLEAARHSLYRDFEVLASEVAINYWELWRQLQLTIVAIQSEEEAKIFLDETRKLAGLGLREDDDIYQAESAWLERRSERLLAQAQNQKKWNELKSQLALHQSGGWEEVPDLDMPQNPVELEPMTFESDMIYKRQDLLAAEKILEAGEELKKGMSGKLLPELNALGGYSFLGLDPDLGDSVNQVKDSEIKGWNIGMELRHSFGQNFDRSEIDQAESLVLASRGRAQSLQNAIEEQTKNQISSVKLNFELLGLAKKIEDRRRKVQSAFRKKFSQGRTTIQDLLRSQEEYRRSRYARQIAEAQLAIAIVRRLLSQGAFLEHYSIDPAAQKP